MAKIGEAEQVGDLGHGQGQLLLLEQTASIIKNFPLLLQDLSSKIFSSLSLPELWSDDEIIGGGK